MEDIKSIIPEYRQAVVFLLICCAIILVAKSSFAGERGPFLNSPHGRFTGSAKLEVKDNLITADLTDADIPDVLNEIGKGTGIKITMDPALTGKKTTAKFEDKDVEGALGEVLRGQYYVIDYSQDSTDKTHVIKDVNVKGDVIGSKPLPGRLIKVEISYGKGKGEVGVFEGAEGSSDGPASYAVDNNDNILILDRLNNRVQIYSSTGNYLSTIPLRNNVVSEEEEVPAISHDPIDIVADNFGFFYVHDSEDKIYQYDKKGNIISNIKVDNSSWGSRVGPMKIVNNELFMGVNLCDANRACGNALLGRIGPDKKLVKPTAEEAKKPWDARKFQSGKTYRGRQYVEGYNQELNIFDSTGTPFEMISIPAKHILTRELLGEDEKGNFYFKTRTVENEDRLYNIDEFSPDGDYIGTAQIPGGTYSVFPAAKDFLVNQNGNIFYYVPEKDSLKIFIFLNSGNK